jgi:tape measure domain-containing protein
MTTPIDRAYVAIVPDLREFNNRVKQGVHDALNAVSRDLDQVNQSTQRALNNVAQSQRQMFADTGRQIRTDLNNAVRDAGAEASRTAAQAGQNVADQFTRGADGKLRDGNGRFVRQVRDDGEQAGDEAEKEGRKAGQRWGDGMQSGARSGDQAIGGLKQHIGGLVALGTTIGIVAGQAIVGMAHMAASAVKAGIQTAASMEQAQIAFETLLGSSRKASDFINQLKVFAAKTPFELPGLIDASRQLLGVGENVNNIIPLLTAFGDASGALGLSQDNFNHIMLATSQAMSAGALHAGDLLQITQAGLPVWKLLSEATGKPVATLKQLSEQGKLLTADILPKLQAQMEKDYGGAMAKQSQTLTGLWSTMSDTFHQGLANALIPMEPLLRKAIPAAANVMQGALTSLGTGMSNFFNGLSGNVKRMNQSDRPKLELFGLGVRAMFHSFKDGDVTSRGFVGVMERIGVALRQVSDVVKTALGGSLDFIKREGPGVFAALVTAVTNLGHAVSPLLMEAWQAWRAVMTTVFGFIIHSVIPVVVSLTKFLSDHKTLVQSLVVVIGTIVIAMKAYGLAVEVTARAIVLFGKAQLLASKAMAFMAANPVFAVIAGIAALAAGLIYAYKHSETFRNIVDKVGRVIRAVAVTAFNALRTAIDFVMDHWKLFAAGLAILFPGLAAIAAAIVGVIYVIRHWGDIVDAFKTAWAAAWGAVKTAWDAVYPVFKVIGEIFYAVIGGSILLVIKAFELQWQATWAAVRFAWDNLGKPMIDAIGAAVMLLWNYFIKPQLDAIKLAWDLQWTAMKMAWEHVGKPIFDAVVAAVRFMVTGAKAVFTALSDAWSAVWSVLRKIWSSVGKPIFDGIGSVVGGLWSKVFSPVFKKISDGWKGLWNGLPKALGGAWDTVTSVAVGGVNVVIDVLNGFIGAIDWILDKLPGGLHIDKIGHIGSGQHHTSASSPSGGGQGGVKAIAKGGVLPGYAPGRDSIAALLSPGEGILVPEAVRALGPNFVHSLNAMFGGARVAGSGSPGHFGIGGVIGGIGSAIGGAIKKTALAPLRAALTAAEIPVNAALNMLPNGILRSLGKGMFAKVDHGIRSLLYDRGGVLPPGVTLAVNNTGRNEHVVSTPPAAGGAFIDYDALAAALVRALTGAAFVFDGDGLAKLVTTKQNAIAAKGQRR